MYYSRKRSFSFVKNEPNPGGIDFNVSSLKMCLRFVFLTFDQHNDLPLEPSWCTKYRVKIQVSTWGGTARSLCVFRKVPVSPTLLSLWWDTAQLKPRATDLQHENNEPSATRLWGWKHEGSHQRLESLKKVLILCRTSITQFQVVKVTNAEGIIGWGIFHPLICQLDGEAGLQLVALHFDSGSFIFLPFVLESHTYKIRFLSWNEKLMIKRKPGGMQSIFFSQNETF